MSYPFESEHLRTLFRYWDARRLDGRLPSRRDIDPAELRTVLPHMMLTDVLENGTRFRYRLAGTAVVQAFGRDVTGHDVAELIFGTYRDFILNLYHDIVAERRPIYSQSTYYNEHARAMSAERLMLPLASDGETVDMVMSVQVFKTGRPHRNFTVRLAQERSEEIAHLRTPLDWEPEEEARAAERHGPRLSSEGV